METWTIAQGQEREWWGDCQNTFGEELKQLVYAKYMGLNIYDTFSIDKTGLRIIDIGGGPVSMLLKTKALLRVVVDPCDYPKWTYDRYVDSGILVNKQPAEDIPLDGILPKVQFDEAWCYNCLQHTQNPEKICKNIKAIAKFVRIFEWVDHPTNEMHPHKLTEAQLNDWLGIKGTVLEVNEGGCVGKCYTAYERFS